MPYSNSFNIYYLFVTYHVTISDDPHCYHACFISVFLLELKFKPP